MKLKEYILKLKLNHPLFKNLLKQTNVSDANLDAMQNGIECCFSDVHYDKPDNYYELLDEIQNQGVILVSGHFGDYFSIPHIIDSDITNKRLVSVTSLPIFYNVINFLLLVKGKTNLDMIHQKNSFDQLKNNLLKGNSIYLIIDSPSTKPTDQRYEFMGKEYSYYTGLFRLYQETKKPIWSLFVYSGKIELKKWTTFDYQGFLDDLSVLNKKFPDKFALSKNLL